MRIPLCNLQTLGQRITAIQKGNNASQCLGVDLHIAPISQWLIKEGLSIGGSGACMGGPHLGENHLPFELMFDGADGEFSRTKSHDPTGGIPWISIEKISSKLQKEFLKATALLNKKVWSTIGEQQLSEQQKQEMIESRGKIHSTYLSRISSLADATDEVFETSMPEYHRAKADSLPAMERDFLANHFPEDIQRLQKFGLDQYPREIQNRLISRMLSIRNGKSPIDLEIDNRGDAFIHIHYPIQSLTLLNQIFAKLP